ncbi:uncharacterized protein LOC130734376 [Lotus japonicus]|uniref:uncharacterized protein LOC130734376 n=1 Tax=Lotus japonicus TaxID=34305 RepID=UPI002583B991|nr:uncharacterized protein LOC130734376 [Lotus japonicus]
MSADTYLPEECWEYIFTLLNQPQQQYLEPVSLVSKQFLSITNRLQFSLAIHDHPLPLLPHLFHRFPNLTSLDLTRFHGELDALLLQISRHPLRLLTSLKLSHNQTTFPAHVVRAESSNLRQFLCIVVAAEAAEEEALRIMIAVMIFLK